MIDKVLLDANFLIYILDQQSNQKSGDEQQRLKALESAAEKKLLQHIEAGASLFITPLIEYEILCGAKSDEQRDNLKAGINAICEPLQINNEIARLAALLYRKNRYAKPVDKKKYRFDNLHFATAKHYNMLLETVDADFSAMERTFAELQSSGYPQ